MDALCCECLCASETELSHRTCSNLSALHCAALCLIFNTSFAFSAPDLSSIAHQVNVSSAKLYFGEVFQSYSTSLTNLFISGTPYIPPRVLVIIH